MFNKLFEGQESDLTKVCGICKKSVPISNFSKDGGANYLRYECKSCAKQQSKIIRKIKKTAPRIPKDYICPICNLNEQQIKKLYPNKKNVWCCDHNHTTNTFRGWLCHKCNLALGNFNDSTKRLNNALKYLTKA